VIPFADFLCRYPMRALIASGLTLSKRNISERSGLFKLISGFSRAAKKDIYDLDFITEIISNHASPA